MASRFLRRKTAAFFSNCLANRQFTTGQSGHFQQEPRVPVLKPTLWSLTVVGAIYIGCAAYEVHQDVQRIKTSRWSSDPVVTFHDIEVVKEIKAIRSVYTRHDELPDFSSPPAFWNSLDSANKAIAAMAGLNIGVYGLNSVLPATRYQFGHTPVPRHHRPKTYTLFTSNFVHGGFFHLFLNSYCLYLFAPRVADSSTFQSSGSHFSAFYLSAGILSSLGQHLTTIWPDRFGRYIPSMGASGAIMGIVGAFGALYPNTPLGIMFIPGSLPAHQFLTLYALFEAYGLFFGWKFISFAHSAHLSGLGLGLAYVYFDGKKRIWKPTRRFAYNQMRRLHMI